MHILLVGHLAVILHTRLFRRVVLNQPSASFEAPCLSVITSLSCFYIIAVFIFCFDICLLRLTGISGSCEIFHVAIDH